MPQWPARLLPAGRPETWDVTSELRESMHYRYFLEAPGYLAQSERWCLYRLAASLQSDATIVNIGVEEGASMACLRQGNKTASLVGVDIDNTRYNQPFPARLETADSARYGLRWDGGKIDLLFVDGDHTYAGCKADIEAWIPHVAENGIVAFHDCNAPQCEGVTRAVNEWVASSAGAGWVELPRHGTIRVFKRAAPLAVLIPTYKRPAIVRHTVDLLLSNLRHEGQLVVYIGDDSGDNETASALRGYPATMVIPAPRRGLGANLNMLLALTHEPLIAQMDDDHHLMRRIDLAIHADKLMRDKRAGWIHLMFGAVGNEHWDYYRFVLAGDTLDHWRIMPESPDIWLASNQPHIKHRRAHDAYGLYPEGMPTGQTETEFNRRVHAMHRADPDNTPRFYAPVEGYAASYWHHVGDSYAQRGL